MQYLVSGCGVSVLCETQESVVEWIKEMVQRGGTPSVIAVPNTEDRHV